MNIRSIKNRANELLFSCKPQVIRIVVIMMLVNSVPTLFSGEGTLMNLMTFILGVVFLTFDHGHVVIGLKVVRNNAQSIDDNDAFVGFSRYFDLFTTYFLSFIVLAGILFLVSFVVILILVIILGSMVISSAALFEGSAYYTFTAIFNTYPIAAVLVILAILAIAAVGIFVSAYLFAMPYLLERYQMTGFKALKESFSFMNGHVWEMVKLIFSFFGWILLVSLINEVLIWLLAFIPLLGSVIAAIVSGFAAAYLYVPQFIVSQAIFFEEIAYYRYEYIPTETNQEGVINNVE